MFKFNMAFDDILLEPVAKGYNKLPKPIQKGTSNFTSNIATLLSIPNNLLQGNLKQFAHSTGSFFDKYNSRYSRIYESSRKDGLKPHKEDVGQTLGTYGIWSWLLFCVASFRANNCKGLNWTSCGYFLLTHLLKLHYRK